MQKSSGAFQAAQFGASGNVPTAAIMMAAANLISSFIARPAALGICSKAPAILFLPLLSALLKTHPLRAVIFRSKTFRAKINGAEIVGLL